MSVSYLNDYNGSILDPFAQFGIKFHKAAYTHIIKDYFGLKDVSEKMWNQVIDKKVAIDLAMDLIKEYDTSAIRMYISRDSLKLSQVEDIMQDKIFDNAMDCNGWLVFINLDIFSNWAHKCEYYFIKSTTEILNNKDCSWFPSSYIQIETIFDGVECDE